MIPAEVSFTGFIKLNTAFVGKEFAPVHTPVWEHGEDEIQTRLLRYLLMFIARENERVKSSETR